MKPRMEMVSKGARISDGAVVTAGQVVYGTSDGRAWVVIGVVPWRESHQVLARSDDDRHQYRELNPAWLVSERPDGWGRLEDDIAAGLMDTGETVRDCREEAKEFVRRAKALAERDA